MKTKTQVASSLSAATVDEQMEQNKQPIFDPLGLYPKNSIERLTGSIQPMEPPLEQQKAVVDPLSLYQDNSELTQDVAMSKSLPFLKQPQVLNGKPGDRGFDPFNFASNEAAFGWQREAEIKHARIAMLATVGWVLSELSHNNIASQFGLKSILGVSDKVPSILNGGLERVNPLFFVGAISAAAALEFIAIKNDFVTGKQFNFDPLRLGGKNEKEQFYMKEAELFNGRLAMLAITGFAIQEFVLNEAVVNQTPIFFKFFGETVAQLLGTGGAISV